MAVDVADELLDLDEASAVRRHFDLTNRSRLRPLLWVLVAVHAFSGLIGLERAEKAGSYVMLAFALAMSGLALRCGRRIVERYPTDLAAGLLAANLLTIAAGFWPELGPTVGFSAATALFSAFFRLRPGAHAALGLLGIVGMAAGGWPTNLAATLWAGSTTWVTGWVFAAVIRHSSRKRFVAEWQVRAARHRELGRYRAELDLARAVQLSMLPDELPRAPGIDVTAVSLPATEVGGDYYDVFELDDGRLTVVVADVAGHGMASGLVLSGIRSALLVLRDDLHHPARVLERLDEMLRRTRRNRLLVSMSVAVIDPARGELRLASAGMPAPLLRRAGAAAVEELAQTQPPLGTRLPIQYESLAYSLRSGDDLVMVSDGWIEARNARGEEYGERRFAQDLLAAGDGAEGDLRHDLLGRFAAFTGGAERCDDVTLVVIRCSVAKPAGASKGCT